MGKISNIVIIDDDIEDVNRIQQDTLGKSWGHLTNIRRLGTVEEVLILLSTLAPDLVIINFFVPMVIRRDSEEEMIQTMASLESQFPEVLRGCDYGDVTGRIIRHIRKTAQCPVIIYSDVDRKYVGGHLGEDVLYDSRRVVYRQKLDRTDNLITAIRNFLPSLP